MNAVKITAFLLAGQTVFRREAALAASTMVCVKFPMPLSTIAARFAIPADAKPFLRFATVGAAQNAAFYGLGLVMLWLGLRAWQVTAVSYPAATLVSFLANRRWSFARRARGPKSLQKYVILYTAMYPAAVATTRLQELIGLPGWLATLNTMVAAVFVLFISMNFWVFPDSSRAPSTQNGG